MGVRFYRIVALFSLLILLSISLVSVVSASSTITISGKDGLDGIRAADDITKAHAVSDAVLSIVRDDKEYAMTCQERPDGLRECDHTFAKAVLESGEYTLKFKPLDPEGPVFTKTFVVDGDLPTIDQMVIEPVDDKLRLQFRLTDTSAQGVAGCSGVKTIAITTASDSFYVEAISEPNICVYTKDITIQPPRVSGELNFSVVVTDYVGGLVTKNIGPILVDFKSPEILDDIEVLQGEEPLGIIGANPINAPVADIHFKVQDNDLAFVEVDVTAFSSRPELASTDSKRTANCVKETAWYSCVVEKVEINPGSAQAGINITATDVSGYVSNKMLFKTFEVQSESSQVIYFGKNAEHCLDGVCYFKKGMNEVHLHITSQKDLDVSLITVSGSETSAAQYFKPQICNKTGEYYDCTVSLPVEENILPSLTAEKVTLQHPSLDAFGLQLTGISSMQIKTDYDAPEKKSDLNFSVDCPIVGEKGYLRINVTDDSPVVRIKTSPKKITSNEYFEAACKNEGSVFVCELELKNFVSYAEDEELEVIIEDIAGNQLLFTQEIQVCEAEGDYPPETIASINTNTNQKIDRRTMSFIAVKAYLPLEINKKNQNTEITDLDTDGCVGTTGLSGRPYFINKFSSKPILVIPIGGPGQVFEETSAINVNCTIKVYEKRGTTRFTKPEEEILIATLGTFRQELGTIDLATSGKLLELTNQIKDLDDSIESMEKYLKILDKICSSTATFNKVFSIASGLKTIVYGTAVTLEGLTGTGEGLWKAMAPVFDSIEEFRNTVWPIGKIGDVLQLGEKAKVGVDNIMKLGCLIYNCGQCSVDGIMQGINIAGSWKKELEAIEHQELIRPSSEEEKQSLAEKIKNGLTNAFGVYAGEGVSKALDTVGINKDNILDVVLDKVPSEAKEYVKQVQEVSKNPTVQAVAKESGLSESQVAMSISSTAKGMTQQIENLGDVPSAEKDKLVANLKKLGFNEKGDVLQGDDGVVGTVLSERELNEIQNQVEEDTRFTVSVAETYGLDPSDVMGKSYDELGESIENEQEVVDELDIKRKRLESIYEDSEQAFNNDLTQDEYYALDTAINGLEKDISDLTSDIQSRKIKISSLKKYQGYDLDTTKSAFEDRAQKLTAEDKVTILDPYESIEFAKLCGCAPGILYAKEKLRQLKCREYTCIEQNAMNGLPITSCEVDFDEGKCMYYSNPISSQSYLDGIINQIADNFFFGATDEGGWEGMNWRNVDNGIITSRKILCMEEYIPGDLLRDFGKFGKLGNQGEKGDNSLALGWRSVWCAASGAYLTVRDFESYWKGEWYESTLRDVPGEDYCEGVPLNE